MNESNFAETLKKLMKERKVSGQKIADAVGVSQKTISRYATGEVEPNESMQKRIMEAIADIGGHPDDAERKRKPLAVPISLRDTFEAGLLVEEEELLALELRELEEDKEKACKVFSLLEESNQQFLLKNISVFSKIEVYEIAIVEAYAAIAEDKRKFIIESLETLHLKFTDVKENPNICKKVAGYLEMMAKCHAVVPERLEKFGGEMKDLTVTDNVKLYARYLEQMRGVDVEKLAAYLPELITFDEKDWYLLMLVQLMGLSDKGMNVTYDGRFVGDKVNGLISYIEKLAEEKGNR